MLSWKSRNCRQKQGDRIGITMLCDAILEEQKLSTGAGESFAQDSGNHFLRTLSGHAECYPWQAGERIGMTMLCDAILEEQKLSTGVGGIHRAGLREPPPVYPLSGHAECYPWQSGERIGMTMLCDAILEEQKLSTGVRGIPRAGLREPPPPYLLWARRMLPQVSNSKRV
jgi:hypothetical protein